MFQNLPHGYLAVQHRTVRPDDLDVHVPHRYKVTHLTLPAGGHGGGPLLDDLAAPLLGKGLLALARPAYHPVLAGGLKNLQPDACQKGHGAQQGYPAGGVSCGLEWCKQEQLLPRQLPDCPRLSSAQEEVHGAVPQPRLYLLWIGTEQGSDIPAVAGQHHLPQTVAAGEQVVQIPVQEGLDAPLPPARVHSSPKAIQARLSPAVSTPGSRPATQPYQLPDGGVH